jgi:hypothetical protein
MKRIYLLFALAGAFGMTVMGSASSVWAACPAGTVGTQLNGNYAVKIVGALTDTGTPATGDPQPKPLAAVGVFDADGNCDITGGELIVNKDGSIDGPAKDADPYSSITAFSGSLSANLSGSYSFDKNNFGTLTLIDTKSASLGSVTYLIAIERGNQAFHGARSNPGDPVSITGNKQATVTSAQFAQSFSFLCDSVGLPNNGLGLGYNGVSGMLDANLDPETGTNIEAGGLFVYNNNNGYVQSPSGNGGQNFPPGGGAFACAFDETLLGTQSLVDGTENADWATDNTDGNCAYFDGDAFQTSLVLWGSANQNAFMITTGGYGIPFAGVDTCAAGVRVVGRNTLVPASVTLTSTLLNPHPSQTLLLTNNTGKPLNFSNITGTGVAFTSGDVTLNPNPAVVGGVTYIGCGPQGELPPTNPLPLYGNAENITNPCAITVTNSGPPCTTTLTGTLTIAGNDAKITGGTQTTVGDTVPVTCKFQGLIRQP